MAIMIILGLLVFLVADHLDSLPKSTGRRRVMSWEDFSQHHRL